jgi:hypothetical protein
MCDVVHPGSPPYPKFLGMFHVCLTNMYFFDPTPIVADPLPPEPEGDKKIKLLNLFKSIVSRFYAGNGERSNKSDHDNTQCVLQSECGQSNPPRVSEL